MQFITGSRPLCGGGMQVFAPQTHSIQGLLTGLLPLLLSCTPGRPWGSGEGARNVPTPCGLLLAWEPEPPCRSSQGSGLQNVCPFLMAYSFKTLPMTLPTEMDRRECPSVQTSPTLACFFLNQRYSCMSSQFPQWDTQGQFKPLPILGLEGEGVWPLLHIHGLCIYVLWLSPSPFFIQYPRTLPFGISLCLWFCFVHQFISFIRLHI